MGYYILWTHQCVSGTDCKLFQRKNCRFTGIMVIRSQSVALNLSETKFGSYT